MPHAGLDVDYCDISDPSFHVRVAALHDIYAVLADSSLELQNTQKLPWERFAAYDAAITKLDSMIEALNVGLDDDDKEEWPTLVTHRNSVESSEVRFSSCKSPCPCPALSKWYLLHNSVLMTFIAPAQLNKV